MIFPSNDLLAYSLGYFKLHSKEDAMFFIHPFGALKGSIFLINEAFRTKVNHGTVSICSSVSQRKTLKDYKENVIISYPSKAHYVTLKFRSILYFIFVVLISLVVSLRKNSILVGTNYFQRFALNTQIITGYFISNKLIKTQHITKAYVSSDHCPIVLSALYHLKKNNSKLDIFYKPHGGHVGYLNEYRVATWDKFDTIIPNSYLQRDVFNYWAKKKNVKINFDTKDYNSQAIINDKILVSPASKPDTYVFWLNQADIWNKNTFDLKRIVQLLNRGQSLSIGNIITVSKDRDQQLRFTQITQLTPERKFYSFEEYDGFRKNLYDRSIVHVCLSSSVITDVLTFSQPIYFTARSPLNHDEALSSIVQKAGLCIKKENSSTWYALPNCGFNPEYFTTPLH
jgi:hypothetical protein